MLVVTSLSAVRAHGFGRCIPARVRELSAPSWPVKPSLKRFISIPFSSSQHKMNVLDGGQPSAWAQPFSPGHPGRTSFADKLTRKGPNFKYFVVVNIRCQCLDLACFHENTGCSLPAPAWLCSSTGNCHFEMLWNGGS